MAVQVSDPVRITPKGQVWENHAASGNAISALGNEVWVYTQTNGVWGSKWWKHDLETGISQEQSVGTNGQWQMFFAPDPRDGVIGVVTLKNDGVYVGGDLVSLFPGAFANRGPYNIPYSSDNLPRGPMWISTRSHDVLRIDLQTGETRGPYNLLNKSGADWVHVKHMTHREDGALLFFNPRGNNFGPPNQKQFWVVDRFGSVDIAWKVLDHNAQRWGKAVASLNHPTLDVKGAQFSGNVAERLNLWPAGFENHVYFNHFHWTEDGYLVASVHVRDGHSQPWRQWGLQVFAPNNSLVFSHEVSTVPIEMVDGRMDTFHPLARPFIWWWRDTLCVGYHRATGPRDMGVDVIQVTGLKGDPDPDPPNEQLELRLRELELENEANKERISALEDRLDRASAVTDLSI